MKKRTRNILIICAVVLLLAAGTVALAEFTKSSRAKRVAVTVGGSGVRFSSNYLETWGGGSNGSPYAPKSVYASDDSSGIEFNITVCNYPQGDPTRYYERPITYDLVFDLVTKTVSGNTTTFEPVSAAALPSNYEISLSFAKSSGGAAETAALDSSAVSGSFTSTLTPGDTASTKAKRDLLTVSMSPEAVAALTTGGKEILLRISTELSGTVLTGASADPSFSSSYPDLKNLNAVISSGIASDIENITWSGFFNEAGADNGSGSDQSAQDPGASAVTPAPPSYLDGFNYVVSGNGSGIFTLCWDPSVVQINQYFPMVELLFTPRPTAAPTSTPAGYQPTATPEGFQPSPTPSAIPAPTQSTLDSTLLGYSGSWMNSGGVRQDPETGWCYVQFAVDSDNVSRYDLQFYRAAGFSANTTWQQLLNSVVYCFEPAA